MRSRPECLARIVELLSKVEMECAINKFAGVFDINRMLEEVFCGVLNITLGIELKNLNEVCRNTPAIDLGDPESRVAVQITTQNTCEKIQHTLDSFLRHQLDEQYDRLIVLIIGKTSRYAPVNVDSEFGFDIERDVWDIPRLVQKIRSLEMKQLEQIQSWLEGYFEPKADSLGNRFEKLYEVLKLMQDNLDNDREEFWQTEVFKKNPWILSMVLGGPFEFLKDKAYVGGKGLDNKGGNVVDFIYKNSVSNNVVLIEIKTPRAKIIAEQYRGTYSFSPELSGAVNQVLNYRDKMTKEYYSLTGGSESEFVSFSPECVVIIGKLSPLNVKEIAAFENYRNILSGVTIMTFDEVYLRIKSIVETFVSLCE